MESAQPQITVMIRDVLGGVATYWANLLNELPSQTACVILVRDKHDHDAPTEQLFWLQDSAVRIRWTIRE